MPPRYRSINREQLEGIWAKKYQSRFYYYPGLAEWQKSKSPDLGARAAGDAPETPQGTQVRNMGLWGPPPYSIGLY